MEPHKRSTGAFGPAAGGGGGPPPPKKPANGAFGQTSSHHPKPAAASAVFSQSTVQMGLRTRKVPPQDIDTETGERLRSKHLRPAPAPTAEILDGLLNLGLGEAYQVPDSFERLKQIDAIQAVRTEPAERVPWEALKKYAAEAKLARPAPATDYFSTRAAVDLYVLTIDYSTSEQWYQRATGGGALVRLFGITNEGHSACFYVEQFWPYFWADISPVLQRDMEKHGRQAALDRFREWLDEQTRKRDPRYNAERDGKKRYVRSVSLHNKINGKEIRGAYYYQREGRHYLRIEMSLPRYVPMARDVLAKRYFVRSQSAVAHVDGEDEHDMDTENGEQYREPTAEELIELEQRNPAENGYGTEPIQVYEADCEFVLRFMVDKSVSGCGWVRAPVSSCRATNLFGKPVEGDPSGIELGAVTQVALRIDYDALESQTHRADVPSELRLLAIDIEAATHEKRAFPVPSLDPVICVSVNYYRLKDGAKPLASVGFSVGKCTPVAALSHMVTFTADATYDKDRHAQWSLEARRDLLLALRWFMAELIDFDFLMGYNLPFDQAYNHKQADVLGIGRFFRRYCRTNEMCSSKATSFSSKALGTRETLAFLCPGRISWDILELVRRNEKLKSNKLATAAAEITGKLKLEMPHEMISPLWMTSDLATDDTRARVLEYNENDERITALICFKKGYIWQAQEMARATGVSLEMLQYRGAGIKSISLLLKHAKEDGFLMPTYPDRLTKKTVAGFGVVPEGTLLQFERAANEQLEREAERILETPESLAEALQDKLYERFKIDPLLFSPNDVCYFTATLTGLEHRNFETSRQKNLWALGQGAPTRGIVDAMNKARKRGGRLLLFFIGRFSDTDASKPGKLYGVAQVTGKPQEANGAASSEKLFAPDGAASPHLGAPFTVRWLFSLPAEYEAARLNPTMPWSPSRCDATVPMTQFQARLLMELCRMRRQYPNVDLDLKGEPIEVDTPEAAKRRKKRRKKEGDEEEATIDRGPPQLNNYDSEIDAELADGWDDEGDDDDDKYEGAVVLATIVGLYNVPVSVRFIIDQRLLTIFQTLDFASLYPSLIILHNLCYTTILTRDLINKYELKECPKNADGTYQVDAKGEYLGDFTIKESGHIIANRSLRDGLLCRILKGLLARREIAKGFMGAAGMVKKLIIEKLNVDPSNRVNYDALDREIITGTDDPKTGKHTPSFVEKMKANEATSLPILDNLLSIWARLKDVLSGLGDASAAAFASATRPLRDELLGEASFLAQLFDARQNALKISANSMYGFSGARVGRYPMRAIAEVTTSEGRLSINKKRDLVERDVPLPKRFCYGQSLKEWRQNPLVPEAELAKAENTYKRAGPNGKRKLDGEKVDDAQLEDESKEPINEFNKHLDELARTGMRPIVIGGDTDSIFIAWPHCTHPNDAHKLSSAAADYVNTKFKPPQKTTYEKTFWPAVYNAQKKYAGRYWEPKDLKRPKQEPVPGGKDGETRDSIMCKGLESVRRDSTAEVSEAVGVVLRHLLVDGAIEKAAAYIAGLVEAHRTSRTDLSTLLMSKSLSRAPKDYPNPPIHVRLALRLEKRDAATAPRVGDRVPFFVVKAQDRDTKTSELGEDPAFVIEHGTALNVDYYLNKLLRPAIRRILEPLRPGIMKRLFENVPLDNGRIGEVRSLKPGAPNTRMARTRELDDIKEGRAGSEYEPSNVTLRWAKTLSHVDDSKIEAAIKETVECMRAEIGRSDVPYTQELWLDRNQHQVDAPSIDAATKYHELRADLRECRRLMQRATDLAVEFANSFKGRSSSSSGGGGDGAISTANAQVLHTFVRTMNNCTTLARQCASAQASQARPPPQTIQAPKLGLAALTRPRRMCAQCNKTQLPHDKLDIVVCTKCRTSAAFIDLKTFAQRDYEKCTKLRDAAWDHCVSCAGSLSGARPCTATDCDNYFRRRIANQNLAYSAAWAKKLGLDW